MQQTALRNGDYIAYDLVVIFLSFRESFDIRFGKEKCTCTLCVLDSSLGKYCFNNRGYDLCINTLFHLRMLITSDEFCVKPGSHMICNDRRRSATRGRRPSPIVTDYMGTLDTASATVGDERSG